jgi:hypothetical protein
MFTKCSGRSRKTVGFVFSLCILVLSGVASSALAVVPTPLVTGPLASDPRGSPSRNYTFLATDLDLASRGYVEQEFFFSGAGNYYDTPNPFPIGAGLGTTPTANIVSSGHPYKSRMVVRRPIDPHKFNGTVIVEWQNVTSGYDIEALWFRTHEFILRDGYAWIGISAQGAGVYAVPNGLKAWSPVRYGSLDVPNTGAADSDLLSYDIFAQGIQAARSVTAVLGGLPVKRVIATGVSQSAGRLSVYVNAVHPRDLAIIDAALLYVGGTKIRDDLSIPVMKLLSETELAAPQVNEIPSLQPDTDKIRVWETAGTSHSDWASFVVRYALLKRDLPAIPLFDSCNQPSRSRIPDRYVIAAAIDAIGKWFVGVQPPHSPSLVSGSPLAVQRDAFGNALGGIRLASFAVPVALDQGPNSGPGTCFLNGVHIPFETATVDSLYSSHQVYVQAVRQAADQNLADGFLLKDDAKELVANANSSVIGNGLSCGPSRPLCANFKQFPLNPSSSILRDHTQFYYFVGGEELLATMDQANQWVATGYSQAEQPDAKSQTESRKTFSRAIGFLQSYIDKVQQMASDGRAAPESAALLIDYANTLITKLQPLT